jgi:hypothetical protein
VRYEQGSWTGPHKDHYLPDTAVDGPDGNYVFSTLADAIEGAKVTPSCRGITWEVGAWRPLARHPIGPVCTVRSGGR